MSDLVSLFERVKEAAGPDRELDVAICAALAPEINLLSDCSGFVTESLDAALALVEKVLPTSFANALYWMGHAPGSVVAAELEWKPGRTAIGQAASRPLAILAALLLALIEKGRAA